MTSSVIRRGVGADAFLEYKRQDAEYGLDMHLLIADIKSGKAFQPCTSLKTLQLRVLPKAIASVPLSTRA